MDNLRLSRRNLSGFILCVVSAAWAVAADATDKVSEDALKAAYLYRFPGYVEWPSAQADVEKSGGENSQPFTIAILGSVEVAKELEPMLAAQPIKSRPARVRRITSIAEVGDAQVLFIGSVFSSAALRKLIAPFENKPILIVTDDSHGLEMGSTINFLPVERRIRFEVSLPAAKRAGLEISSELLSVALRVQSGLSSDEACGDGTAASAVQCTKTLVSR